MRGGPRTERFSCTRREQGRRINLHAVTGRPHCARCSGADSVRAEARRDSVAQTISFSGTVANNKELAFVFRRGVGDYEALDEDEKIQFQLLFTMLAATADAADVEHHLGIWDREWFEAEGSGFRRLVATRGGRAFWGFNRHSYCGEFAALSNEDLPR